MLKRDLFFSLCLVALGVATAVASIRMPRMEQFGYGPYAAPGVVPGVLGAALTVLALALFVRSVRALKRGEEEAKEPAETPGAARSLAVVLALVVIYTVVLIGSIAFWLATALFVFAFIVWFEWKPSEAAKPRLLRIGTALLQAVLVAVAVTLLFEEVFKVALPGV